MFVASLGANEMIRLLVVGVFPALVFAGCNGEEPSNFPAGDDTQAITLALDAAESACMLTVVNSCYYTRAFFDHDLGWDRRAAEAFAVERNGADGLCGTQDDTFFADAESIDTVPYVGDSAMSNLLDFVNSLGCTQNAAVVDGVGFSESQAESTLAAVNLSSRQQFEQQAHLPHHATSALLAARPFTTQDLRAGIKALAAVKFIGKATLLRLRTYGAQFIPTEQNCDHLASTVQGIEFTGNQAFNLLDFVNHGALEDLILVKGIGTTLAARVLAGGPYDTVEVLAAVKGLGVQRLRNLRDSVSSLWCTEAGSSCGCSSSVRAAVLGVLDHAEMLMNQHDVRTTERFFRLLGKEGYSRFKAAVTDVLATELWNMPPAPTDSPDLMAETALHSVLDQDLFTNPFTLIELSRATPNHLESSLQAAVDVLIQQIAQSNLEFTDVGVSFADLIEGENLEALYLVEIEAWRQWLTQEHELSLVELSHSWLFTGRLVGLTVQVTVSRLTGNVLSVEIL